MWQLLVATDAIAKRDQSLFGWNDRAYIESLFSKGPMAGLDLSGLGYYEGHETQEIKIRRFVRTLTRDEGREHVQHCGTLPYFSRLFEQKISLYQMAAARKQVVDSSPNLRVPGDLIQEFGEDFTESDYAEYSIREYNSARIALRFVYNIAFLLHRHFHLALRYKVFDEDDSVHGLEEKLKALQEHFCEACRILGKPEQDLTRDPKSMG